MHAIHFYCSNIARCSLLACGSSEELRRAANWEGAGEANWEGAGEASRSKLLLRIQSASPPLPPPALIAYSLSRVRVQYKNEARAAAPASTWRPAESRTCNKMESWSYIRCLIYVQ